MTSAVLGGTLVLAFVCGAFLVAGAALALVWRSAETRTELALDVLLSATALAMLVGSLLAVAGLVSLPALVAAAAATGSAGYLAARERTFAALGECTRAGLGALARSPLLWIVALLALFTVARGLAIPPLAWDGLTYHLTYPASWLKNGGVVRLEGGGCWETYETFPKGAEALWLWTMAPFGRDYLVNLTNLPAWLGIALAVRAAAHRLGLSGRGQDLAALVVVACPAYFSYVTPAYVEVPKGFAIAAAIAAGVRAVERNDARPLVPMGLALGVGLAVKLEALSWLPLGLVAALLCARAAPRAALRFAALGGLLGFAVALPWYARNTLVCANPIYPSPLPGFREGAPAGSLQAWWSMTETSVMSQASWGRVIDYLLIPPWAAKYPLGPFWALVGTLVLLPVLVAVARGRARARAFGLAFVSLHLLGIYLITPYNGLYVDADTRFLGPVLVAAVLGVGAALAGGPVWLARLVGALAFLNALAYLRWAPTFHAMRPSAPSVWLAACLLCALVLGTVSIAPAPPVLARRARQAALLFAFAAFLALPASLFARERARFAEYEKGYDLHPTPGASKSLWPVVAELPPSRIAFSVDGIDYTEGWFFYPLFGPDLRHTVTYVGIERDDRPACQRRGMIRDEPDEAAWLARIERERIDYVALRHTPIENTWMRKHPERFAVRYEGKGGALYKVLHSRP